MIANARVAVLDLGTNTTRMLIADVSDGEVAEVERRTRITRLGQGVDASGKLAEEAIGRVMAALTEYRDAIDAAGAERVVALATSAVRDADNGDELRALVRERLAIEVRTISGEEEARLTFRGATGGRRGGAPLLVLDIGGGSTELVVGAPGSDPAFFVSTALGSVRQTERHLASDPPQRGELEALTAELRDTIGERVPAGIREETAAGIAVAGTATSLAAIAGELDESASVHGHRLSQRDCERMLAMLAGMPLVERRRVTGLAPERAPTIVAGAAILVETMRCFELAELDTSERDLLHGAALLAVEGA